MVRVTDFLRDERGTMAWMGLTFTLMALLAGGISIDLMRHEHTRGRVQQALDFCTMNVAAVQRPGTVTGGNTTATNTETATAIKACMDRLGPGASVPTVAATVSGTTFKPVTSTAAGTQTNQFMQMLNISSTGVNVASNATAPATSRVEVSLAYESSNAITAMGIGGTLRSGLTGFVTRLFDTSGAMSPSITLVPYNDGVNLSSTMLARYNAVTNVSGITDSLCIDLDRRVADYSTVPMLTTTTGYQTMMMFDLASTTTRNYPIGTTPQWWFEANDTANATAITNTSAPCPARAGNVLRPQQDGTAVSTINANIVGMQMFGGVRWDHGMHWASAMLDPSANAAVGTLGSAGINTRPLAYGTTDLQKVIVFVNSAGSGNDSYLTGNGTYTTIASAYTSGNSPIYRNSSVTPARYCLDVTTVVTSPRFWLPNNASNTGGWATSCGTGFTRLTWPQVWSSVRATWVAWQLYARGMQSALPNATWTVGGTSYNAYLTALQNTYNTTMANFQTTISFATQTSNFLAECTAAKAAGITIYTVGLNAIARAKGPLQSCATSDNHYFDATTANFADVMRVIAQTINQQGYSQ